MPQPGARFLQPCLALKNHHWFSAEQQILPVQQLAKAWLIQQMDVKLAVLHHTWSENNSGIETKLRRFSRELPLENDEHKDCSLGAPFSVLTRNRTEHTQTSFPSFWLNEGS